MPEPTNPHAHLLAALHEHDDWENGGTEWERPEIVEAIAAAAERDRMARIEAALPDQPELEPMPELDTARLLDMEKFRLANVSIVETDPANGDDVSVPQVLLLLEGMPAKLTLTGHKSYLTALGGQRAIAVGKGLLESGKVIAKAEDRLRKELEVDTRVNPGGTLLTATPADMAAAQAEHRAQQVLRGQG